MEIYNNLVHFWKKTLAIGGLVAILGGCNKYTPDVDKPENLLIVGHDDGINFYFVKTPRDGTNGGGYRLHVKTAEGCNLILFDDNIDGEVDSFTPSLTKEDAQALYNQLVPLKYRLVEKKQ